MRASSRSSSELSFGSSSGAATLAASRIAVRAADAWPSAVAGVVVREVPAMLSPVAGRRDGGRDRRVPALWISEQAPKLGWCWDGNPHSWLGLASAGSRVVG